MANVTPDKMRAFGVPRKQNAESIWQAETTATQQSARSGVPVAQQSTGLVLAPVMDMHMSFVKD